MALSVLKVADPWFMFNALTQTDRISEAFNLV